MGLSKELSCEAWSFSAATSTPTGVFTQRFEALFPRAGALGWVVCFARCSSGLSVRECGATGSASGRTACPVCPTLCQSWSCHSNASPLRPGCPSLPLLPVWMNVYFLFHWCRTSLPLDFLSVLVVRGGAVCLPTYAAILVPTRYKYTFVCNSFFSLL